MECPRWFHPLTNPFPKPLNLKKRCESPVRSRKGSQYDLKIWGMPVLKELPKNSKKTQKRGHKREYQYSIKEKRSLKKISLKISYDLENRFQEKRPIEWLSWETNIARSALREIMAGRSNPKFLTLLAISEAFEYKNLPDFLKDALK